MKTGRYACPILWADRISKARQVADDGGLINDVAKAWGTSAALVSVRLRTYAPEIHQQLKSNPNRTTLSPETVRDRLRIIARTATHAEAARALNISQAGVIGFLKRYAPFGVQDALQDYEEAA